MASEGLELPQEVDYDVEEKQGEKEASKFQYGIWGLNPKVFSNEHNAETTAIEV